MSDYQLVQIAVIVGLLAVAVGSYLEYQGRNVRWRFVVWETVTMSVQWVFFTLCIALSAAMIQLGWTESAWAAGALLGIFGASVVEHNTAIFQSVITGVVLPLAAAVRQHWPRRARAE